MQHSNKMSQSNSNQTVKFKRMKQLFLLFLKQFEVDDYKLLIRFLQLIINNYNLNPSKLFGFLTNQSDNSIENELSQPIAAAAGQLIFKPTHHSAHKQHEQAVIKPSSSLIKLNKKLKYISPTSYFNKQRRNFLIREHQFKLKELNRLAKNKRKQINESNHHYNRLSKRSSNIHENQSDQENIQFFEENDNEINFAYQNYQLETAAELGKEFDSKALNINTLSDRNEIIDSFVLKDNEDNDYENDEEEEGEKKKTTISYLTTATMNSGRLIPNHPTTNIKKTTPA